MLPVKRQLGGGLYRVEGPMRLRVLEGSFYALGRSYAAGDELIVPRGGIVCLKVEERCLIDHFGGTINEAKPEEEVIDEWKSLAEGLAAPGRVVVVGEVDSGKTTFSTFLLNTALTKGLKVALIDADLGQNDVGWPGTVALALPEHPVSWLGELEPSAFYFVGTNTPMGCEDAVILGVSKLLRSVSGKDLVIVNTDGWVFEKRALTYKCRLVEAVEPSALVVMKGTGAAEAIAQVFKGANIRVVRAPTPPAARGKERELRKMRRELSYIDLLRKSSVRTISLGRVKLWASYTFNGQRDEKLGLALSELLGFEVYAEVCGNVVVLTVAGEKEYRKLIELKEQISKLTDKEVVVSCLSGLKGFLVGFMNDRLEHVGIGVLEEVDLKEGVVKVRTPFNTEGVSVLIVGRLRLTEEGAERERGLPPLA